MHHLRSLIAATLVTGLSFAVTSNAQASVQARSGLPQGLNLGIGLTGSAVDYALGPVSIGGAVTGSQVGFSYGSLGGNLNPSARLVFTTRHDDHLSFGLVVGGSAPLTYPTPTPVQMVVPSPIASGSPVVVPVFTQPSPSRVPIGDVGLAVSYQFNLPSIRDFSLPVTVSPTVTFMLDGRGNVTFGPHTSLEVAARFTPDVELTFGGGTSVGLRFKI